MALSFSRWRARHLFGAWCAYWVGLAVLGVVALWPSISAISRFVGGTAKGSITLGIDDGMLALTVAERGREALHQTASLLSLALWIAGPPLLLWVAWLLARPRRSGQPPSALPAGEAPFDGVSDATRRRESERARTER